MTEHKLQETLRTHRLDSVEVELLLEGCQKDDIPYTINDDGSIDIAGAPALSAPITN
jgi:hypothetical protein